MSRTVTIGCGSGYAEDRLEPATALADSGLVEVMAFDCLAERTLALGQVRRLQDPSSGQDQRIHQVVENMAEFIGSGGRVVGNFGVANPDAALADVIDALRKTGQDGTAVGVIRGDDVLSKALEMDLELPELGSTVLKERDRVVSAHAYIGADGIVDCLERGGRFVLGGRIADPSLFVGPICHKLGWALDDWDRVGVATVAGHLLECGTHGSGGNFEDPPYRLVPNPHDVGQPMATVSEAGIIVSKLPGSGGAIDERTVKTQLLYEIHDPSSYLTPDVTADFTDIQVEDLGDDRVRVLGACGRRRPDKLKVLVGLDLGWKGIGEISYGGPGCVDRARRGEDIVRKHLEQFTDDIDELRFDLHGMTAVLGDRGGPPPVEVRLRGAARCRTREAAQAMANEIEWLYFGPAGAGGATKSVVPAIGVTPAYLSRELVSVETELAFS